VISQVPSCDPFSLLVLMYRLFQSSIPLGVGSFLNHVVMISHVTLHTNPARSIQEKVISDRAGEHVGLEVFAPIKDVNLGLGTLESSSPFRASDEAIRKRRSSNGVQR
jgi:hypothetical protein